MSINAVCDLFVFFFSSHIYLYDQKDTVLISLSYFSLGILEGFLIILVRRWCSAQAGTQASLRKEGHILFNHCKGNKSAALHLIYVVAALLLCKPECRFAHIFPLVITESFLIVFFFS